MLISQNRQAKISTIREEVNLRVALITEEEVTKSLELLARIRKKMGITQEDEELDHDRFACASGKRWCAKRKEQNNADDGETGHSRSAAPGGLEASHSFI